MATLIYLLPGAALGAIISYVLPFLVGMPPYLIRVLQHQHIIEGKWYSYHYTKQSNRVILRRLRWNIRRDIRGTFTVTCWDDIGKAHKHPIKYGRGKAFIERGHIIMEWVIRKEHAHVTCRILEPIAANEIGAGLWLCYDLDGTLAAGPMVLVRDELDASDGEALLKSRVSAISASKLLEVPTQMKVISKKRQP